MPTPFRAGRPGGVYPATVEAYLKTQGFDTGIIFQSNRAKGDMLLAASKYANMTWYPGTDGSAGAGDTSSIIRNRRIIRSTNPVAIFDGTNTPKYPACFELPLQANRMSLFENVFTGSDPNHLLFWTYQAANYAGTSGALGTAGYNSRSGGFMIIADQTTHRVAGRTNDSLMAFGKGLMWSTNSDANPNGGLQTKTVSTDGTITHQVGTNAELGAYEETEYPVLAANNGKGFLMVGQYCPRLATTNTKFKEWTVGNSRTIRTFTTLNSVTACANAAFDWPATPLFLYQRMSYSGCYGIYGGISVSRAGDSGRAFLTNAQILRIWDLCDTLKVPAFV